MMSEFVRFRYSSEERFAILTVLFEAIKAVKNSQNINFDYDLTELREILPADVSNKFDWPSDEEPYFDPSRPIAISPPGSYFGERWNFTAIVELIDMGDYELEDCKIVDGGYAEISVSAYGYPYGGLNAFIALVEGFGFTVVSFSE